MSEPIGVLHVDDEPDFAEVTADFLEREDDRIEVVTETDVSDGLDRLTTEAFDCIISDHDAPETDGLAFLERIRDDYGDVPFILFTGDGSEKVASEALSAGATDYLQKEAGTDQYAILANRVVNAVETARAKRQRQRQLDAIETAQDGISLLDEDGQFIRVNEAYADLYGYEPEDMIGEHWALIYPDDDVEFVRNEILPTVMEGGDWRGETIGLRADGSTFVEDHTLSTTDNGALICTVRDVTDQRERERELEARSAAMETASDGIALLDASGECTYVNQAHAEVYGYDEPEAFIGESWRMCYSEAELATIEETVLPTLEEDGKWRGELTGQRRDGTHFLQEVTLSARDDGGMVCLVRDITERKQREQALERHRDLFEQTQRMAHVGGWELDLVDDELRWTDEVYRIRELPLDYEPTLDEALDYYHPEDAPVLETAIERAIERGENYDLELRLVTANDDLRWVRARGEARHAGDETVMLRGTVQDITERKEREQELHSTSNLLSTLVENIPAGILAEDSARQIRFTNHEFTELFDIDAAPDDLVGNDCAAAAERAKTRFVAADRFIDSTNEAVADHASIRREEFEVVDGRTFERSGTPVQLEDEGTGYLWVYHDITERKRAEDRFRALFEHLPDPAVIAELTEEEAITRAVNAAFEDVFGYPAETAADASLNDLIVPPEYEDESEQIDRQARSGEQLFREVRRRTADGEVRDFLFRNVLIETGEGAPRAHGIYTDITERKQRERRLNALHDATRDLIAADTRQEVADVASRAAGDVLDLPLNCVYLYDEDASGLVPVAVPPKTHDVVGDPPTFRDGEGIAWQVFESGEPRVYDDIRTAPAVLNPDTPIRSELHLPLGEHGVFLIGSTTAGDFDEADVSLAKVLAANVQAALDRARHEEKLRNRERELQNREQELEMQMDRMEFFNSILRHDVLNGMTVIQGRAEFLTDELDGDQLRDAETILHWSDDIVEIVQRVRATLDTLTDRSDIQLEPVELSETLREEISRVRETYPEVTFETELPDSVQVRANELLSEVVGNIVTNAVEHNETEGLCVSITASGRKDDGTAVVRIADNGNGVPDEAKETIFRRDATGYAKSSGSGFGLFFVDSMVESYGGDVRVEDNDAGGATFVLELPLAEATTLT